MRWRLSVWGQTEVSMVCAVVASSPSCPTRAREPPRAHSLAFLFISLLPAAALMYCLEYLEANFDWLEGRLRPYAEDGA